MRKKLVEIDNNSIETRQVLEDDKIAEPLRPQLRQVDKTMTGIMLKIKLQQLTLIIL